MSRFKPPRDYLCPTCNGRSVVRVRRGGRAFLKPRDRWLGFDSPIVRPIRIYWQRRNVVVGRSVYVVCPDPFHKRDRVSPEPASAETVTRTNLHVGPQEMTERRKSRALKHRRHQDKTRR